MNIAIVGIRPDATLYLCSCCHIDVFNVSAKGTWPRKGMPSLIMYLFLTVNRNVYY